jgi:hypothetical protein
VTFYVKKSLPHGPIRFGVSPRQPIEQVDSEPGLSTGPTGEFLRRSTHGYFFADARPIGAPDMPKPSSISSTPFLAMLKPEDARGWAFVGMMGLGAFLILWGLIVLMQLGPQGWILILLGAGLLVAPIAVTAQKRRKIRLEEDRQRTEFEERDRRNRESMISYATALERLRTDPSEANMKAATKEREQLELSYKHWRPLAKRTVLHLGFNALGRMGAAKADEVSRFMDRAGQAVGLDKPDTVDVKLDLYQSVVWHLLADDRVGPVQTAELEALRRGFGFGENETSDEAFALEQFDRLRGVTRDTLPKQECAVPLQFREHCIHTSRGQIHGNKGADDCVLYLTNKRLIIETRKKRDIPLTRIDDVDVDVNANVMTVQVAKPDAPLRLTVEQPLYTAALIDIATTLDERPRSFA